MPPHIEASKGYDNGTSLRTTLFALECIEYESTKYENSAPDLLKFELLNISNKKRNNKKLFWLLIFLAFLTNQGHATLV